MTRLREEKRAPVNLILAATANKTLQRLADAELDGVKYQVVSFKDGGDEFRVYLDPKSHLPAQTEILEDDPLEGDSSYLLRYGDWRKVDQIVMPFSLRYELNGRALQEEQIKSVQNNVAFVTDPFNVPQAIRNWKDRRHPDRFAVDTAPGGRQRQLPGSRPSAVDRMDSTRQWRAQDRRQLSRDNRRRNARSFDRRRRPACTKRAPRRS